MRFEIPKSKEYNNRLKKVVPPEGHTIAFGMPWESKQIHFMRGSGTRVWDLDGNEYLDFFAKFGANILGHNDARYNANLVAALDGVAAVNLGGAEAETAELICEFVSSAESVRFSLSGTEAVQNALRLARAYTGKTSSSDSLRTTTATPTIYWGDVSEISQTRFRRNSLGT